MIKTVPVFYYDFRITPNNFYIGFDDGLGQVNAILNPSNYAPTQLANEVGRAMSETGNQVYTCTFDRNTRIFTISAPAPFSLLIASGVFSGLSSFGVLGFTGGDLTASNSYTGNNVTGREFIPQFLPQDFIGFEDFQELFQPSVNESASGQTEVYSTGTRSFMEFNLTLATNEEQSSSGIIRNDQQGIEKLRDFMRYCTTKGDLEYMQDMTDRSAYFTIILESTPLSNTGTGYRLNELYSKGLSGYFETGNLKWRLRE